MKKAHFFPWLQTVFTIFYVQKAHEHSIRRNMNPQILQVLVLISCHHLHIKRVIC